MKRKPFSRPLFDENDSKGRDTLMTYYKQRNWDIRENKDLYGPDLIATKDNKTYYIEVEIKYNWKTDKFPFNSIQLPERKSKFKGLEYPVAFFILKPDLTKAIAFHETELTQDRLVEVPNKYIPSGEYFYQIPLEYTTLIELK